jgi:hypothetical protein
VIYPDNQDKMQYIVSVSNFYLGQYSVYEKQVVAFGAEIISIMANMFDGAQDKAATISCLQSLLENESALESMLDHASLSDDSDDEEIERIVSRIDTLALFLKGDKELITMNLANKAIPLGPGQDLENLQKIVAAMARKCIKEICETNLNPRQTQPTENPTLNPLPQGSSPRQPITDNPGIFKQ